MLKFFRINNIALIPSVEMELGPGLTLLTGETGAGKSILVDALGLLLGARASAELIRSGADHASVEAQFESADAVGLLTERGLPDGDGEVVLRREIHVSGRGRATVNGALVPVTVLRELAPRLAIIHGQHEPQGLLDPDTHLPLLDHHAGLSRAATEVSDRFARVRAIDAELSALARDRRDAERRRDMLEFQAAEIEKQHLRAGEEDELRREKAVLANAGRLSSLCGEAWELLYDAEGSALERLGQVFRRVDELAGIDPRFRPFAEARQGVMAQVEELALFLRDYREGLAFPPGRQDEVESRLATIERLKRKYGASEEQVLAFAARCLAELAGLASPEERERELTAARAREIEGYRGAAAELSRARRRAARDLEKKVEAELGLLAMEKTRFQVGFAPAEARPDDPATWTERGLETAEFLLAPNAGEEPRPLARIASGGELSRIMLALKSVATLDARGQTLVFDEVDAGIGGRVAEVVGKKLRAMGERHQVLCVTHLPQIASLADAHFAVRKRAERGRTVTEVERLAEKDRVEEVARMLGGETISETARKHAREMVKLGSRSGAR